MSLNLSGPQFPLGKVETDSQLGDVQPFFSLAMLEGSNKAQRYRFKFILQRALDSHSKEFSLCNCFRYS